MANTKNSDQWYFTKEQLESTPSRQCGFDAMKELQYRQQAANFIQDMGQRLKVSQLCINTAIVYMHRFYVFHSFTHFPWHQMAAAALFLAAKVEEQPRKLEYVIKVANICRNPRDTNIDINSERYIAQSQDLVFNENVLLQTLGFDVAIDHPHTHVVRCCHLVRASKDLAQTSYFMASNSLHLTTMCLQYKPTVVACFCILLACKWSNWKIPLSNEDKEWYYYVDQSVTAELLDQLAKEFLEIFENCPSRLKEKIMALSDNQVHTPSHSSQSNSPFDQDPKKIEGTPHKSLQDLKQGDHHSKHRPHGSVGHHSSRDERREREKLMMMAGKLISSSRPPADPKIKQPAPHGSHPHSRPSTSGNNYPPQASREPRDILREAASKDAPFGLANMRETHSGGSASSSGSSSSKQDLSGMHGRDKREQQPPGLIKIESNNSQGGYPPDARVTYDKQRMDSSGRPRADPNKVSKPDHSRGKYDEQIKKHLSSAYESSKSNSSISSINSTSSQKVKSPLLAMDSHGKSVPYKSSGSHAGDQQPHSSQMVNQKSHYHNNGDKDSTGHLGESRSSLDKNDIKVKLEIGTAPPTTPQQPVVKRSLFSPDSTPPHQKLSDIKKEPISHSTLSAALSPIKSPNNSGYTHKSRTYSSSSTEAELRPTMKKIDQVEGFENIMRDTTVSVHTPEKMKKEVISPVKSEIKRESVSSCSSKSQDSGLGLSQGTIVNGMETNPTIISNLLKEAPTLSTSLLATSHSDQPDTSLVLKEREKEHHHHKSKKKKEKHKHKDKDKNKEDREKKKKHHKDKDKEKHRHKERKSEVSAVEFAPAVPSLSEPIKIKIQKDKIQHVPDAGLKIKIPKERIVDSLPQTSGGGLKIKIPKEMIANCSHSGTGSSGSADLIVSSSRKRDRSSPMDMTQSPPLKMAKSSHHSSSSKQNGRHSYSKVSMGEGDASTHRLAESKHHKQSSST